MKKKSKRSKKATKSSERTRLAKKPVNETNAPAKPELSAGRPATQSTKAKATPVTRSTSARAHVAEGTRLFALAGRPTKAQFVKVYGPQGPKMTWEQRAKAGVDAKHFKAALAAKRGT
jgi:hypothetical protein